MLGKEHKTWLIGLLAGVALYAAAGFLIAPRAIKLWIESPNVSGPTCRLRVQQVYVNPFTMFLSLEDVTLFGTENKLQVSAARAETRIWTVEMLRGKRSGRDVAIQGLTVSDADRDTTILAVPGAFAQSLTVGAGGVFIDAAFARFDQPDATLTRDVTGLLRRPAWLSAPADQQTAACISLAGFEALGGRLRIDDAAVTPAVQLDFHDITATARRKPGRASAPTEINIEARIGAAGTISIEAQLGQLAGQHPDSFSLTTRNVELPQLSPYSQRMLGRDIVAGVGAATLQQERRDGTLRFDNHVSIVGLILGDPHPDAGDDYPPLELPVALATNAAGRTEFFIQGSTSDLPANSVVRVFTNSLAAHLNSLEGGAFDVLAELLVKPDAVLDEIAFLPGSAEMAPAATDTLALLALALKERPLLGMGVRPAYDPQADRAAMAAEQIKLHIALATSKGNRERGDTKDPDFDDQRVRDILDEFADARLPATRRGAIRSNTNDETTMYRNIYLALVDNERISETVLRRLARFRARSVIDTLERAGIDRQRFRIDDVLDTSTTDGQTVTLRLEVEAQMATQDSSHTPR